MSLLKENEEMKAQLAEALEAEKEEEEQEGASAPVKTEEDEAADDGKAEEETAGQAKDEPKKEEVKTEELDNSGMARLRREAAAAKKLADDRAREIEELKKPRAEEPAIEVASDELPPELREVVRDHQVRSAEREFQTYESKITAADYAAVSAEYAQALAASIRIQNPRLSSVEINDLTKRTLLEKAGRYQSEGYENPVAELYHEAKELGFTGQSMLKPEVEDKADPKPDMAKVAANRKRSAGMTGAAGREDGLISKKTAAEMSPAEWKALDRAERARLMSA